MTTNAVPTIRMEVEEEEDEPTMKRPIVKHHTSVELMPPERSLKVLGSAHSSNQLLHTDLAPTLEGPASRRASRMNRKKSRLSIMTERPKNSRFVIKGDAIMFWYKTGRKIYWLLKWFNELKSNEVLREHVKRIALKLKEHEIAAKEAEKMKPTYFDKNEYRAKQEIDITPAVVDILTTPAWARTAPMVKQAKTNLASAIDSFAEYPDNMQTRLCQVAFYQKVNPQRIILRQGHFPENFYFIISGRATVNVAKPKGKGDYDIITVARLNKGQCFGEIALIHNITRTASIESIEEMELLVITKYDFFRIFLDKPTDPSIIPEYIQLCKTITFLRDWPTEKLDEVPGTCVLHYFRPSTLVVANSNKNDWIYIVKSGSCTVMKQLASVAPKRNRNYTDVAGSVESTFGVRNINTKLLRDETTVEDMLNYTDTGIQHKGERQVKDHFRSIAEADQQRAEMYRKIADTEANESVIKMQSAGKYQPMYAAKNVDGADHKSSVFVQMALLRERDVFGLETVQFEDDVPMSHTPVCLVSRGAELVMIHKDLFVKYASAHVKENFRKLIRPYPGETALQSNLEGEIDWQLYRRDILDDWKRRDDMIRAFKHWQ